MSMEHEQHKNCPLGLQVNVHGVQAEAEHLVDNMLATKCCETNNGYY